MEEQWINNLREKMQSYEESEPLGLWEDIEVALNEKKPSPIINRRNVLLWSAGIAAVAAMLTLIFFLDKGDSSLITVPTNIEHTTAKQDIQESTINKAIQEIEESKPLLATNTPSYSKQKAVNNKEQSFIPISDKEDISEGIENEKEQTKVDGKDSDNRQTELAEERQSQQKDYSPKRRADYESIDNYNYRRTSNNKGKLTASVYSTNLPNTSGESSGYGELIARTTLPKQMTANGVEEQNPAGDIIFSNIGQETYTKTEHKQPVKAGLSIRYQLNDKFGIESGLTYTYLSSSLTSGTDKNLYKTEQSLQYLGIPLSVNYKIWGNRQLSFYASAGGLVEKCVAGKSHTDYIIDNKIEDTESTKIKESRLQLSVNSAIGLQYNVSSKLGVFAEPGVGYYFDNGSSIETIYKEKPFNLNLKIGIRVNIN
ncbi:MAG: porin family protein [Bacteroidales bacterium]|nr:porin family protein [Bacteroidales bacterium]